MAKQTLAQGAHQQVGVGRAWVCEFSAERRERLVQYPDNH